MSHGWIPRGRSIGLPVDSGLMCSCRLRERFKAVGNHLPVPREAGPIPDTQSVRVVFVFRVIDPFFNRHFFSFCGLRCYRRVSLVCVGASTATLQLS